LHSRKFTGLIVKFNGNPYRWIDAPYVIRVNDTLGIFDIWETNGGTDRIRIDILQTPFDSVAQMKDSLTCFCAGDSVFYQVVRLDTTAMHQRYWLSFDSTQTINALVTDDTTFEHTSVRFALAQQGATSGQVLKWNGTNWVPANDSIGGGGDPVYYQLVRDNNVSVSQRNATNFYDTGRIEVSVVDDAGNDETEVSFDLAQQGATTGQILRWNGTSWAPATPQDTSATNEAWTIDGDDADTELITNQTVKFQGAGIISTDYNPTTNTMLITGTEVDGSTSNELQTISAGGAGPSSFTVDLSAGGGSVTLTESGIVDLSRSGNTITIAATEVDGSTSNELQTYGHAGTTSYTNTLSSGGGSFTLQASGIAAISHTTGTVTISATEADGSATNEGTLGVGAGSGTSSVLLSNTSGANGVTINAAGILTISETPSSNGGQITITGTEVDGSTTNELQTISASGAGPSSYNIDLSAGGGAVTLSEGSNVDLTRTGNTITIAATAAGGLTGAENGLNVVGSNARLGGTLLNTTSIEGNTNELRFFDGKMSFSAWTGFASAPTQFIRVEAAENVPTLNATPTYDGIMEIRAHSAAGAEQPNSLTIGAYTTDADGIWMQARSASVPNFEYPLSLQPRGGLLSVGRTTGLDALVTFTGSGLAGSTAAGSVLLLENSEGNGKSSLGFGSGADNITGEMAMFHATNALRIINRNTTNGTSSVRIALGGETSDVATFRKSAATSLVQFSVGTVAPHSTLQSAGSLATAYLETVGAPTFDETKRTVVYTANTNISWTIPTTTTCNCPGREYILHHAGTAGTITLSNSVSKGNGTTFNTIAAGEWAYIIYGASGGNIRGYKLTSN